MSTVRTAILKLAAIGAGAALVGGGAVHVAEKAAQGKPQYVKHAKVAKVRPVAHRPRAKETTVATAPCCQPVEQMAAVPLPPPPAPAAALPPPPPEERVETRTRVVHEDLYDHGFGGGFFNGFFGGSTGGYYVASSGGRHHHHGGSTGGSTGGGTPVPAPPMLLLFGAAAASLAGRRKLARKAG